MKVEIKRDIDSWVVTVDGRVHPQGTGFPTPEAAEEFSRSLGEASTMRKCGWSRNQLESLKTFNGAVERLAGTALAGGEG